MQQSSDDEVHSEYHLQTDFLLYYIPNIYEDYNLESVTNLRL